MKPMYVLEKLILAIKITIRRTAFPWRDFVFCSLLLSIGVNFVWWPGPWQIKVGIVSVILTSMAQGYLIGFRHGRRHGYKMGRETLALGMMEAELRRGRWVEIRPVTQPPWVTARNDNIRDKLN